jgi:hypothetical protein
VSLTAGPIPPADDHFRPDFLWWTGMTTREFAQRLEDPDLEQRAYWLGALLREAHTRDVWAFTTPAAVRSQWPMLVRHLGRRRAMWAWLLKIERDSPEGRPWPPSTGA